MKINEELLLWRKWTLYCGIGEFLGLGIAAVLAFFTQHFIGEPYSLAQKIVTLLIMCLAGAIEGSLIAFFQWKILCLRFPKILLRTWWGYTTAIAVIGWFLGMLPSLFFIPSSEAKTNDSEIDIMTTPLLFISLTIITGLILGALFGFCQWLCLRKHTSKPNIWIWGNSLAWAGGLIWIYSFASLATPETSLYINILFGILGGLLTGLTVGAISGYFLLKIKPLEDLSN